MLGGRSWLKDGPEFKTVELVGKETVAQFIITRPHRSNS